MDRKTLRKELIKYYGRDWWIKTKKWLEENVDYPNVKDVPITIADDFHPVFRPLIKSVFDLKNEDAAKNRLIGWSRRDELLNMRVSLLPHYFGILCPVFRSRAVGNFGLISMETEKGDIFSRAFYNLPYPFKQKVKRTIIGCYGLAKHGKKIEDLKEYPAGGVFLLNPDRDEKYESLSKYCDYAYITLNWRFPKTYDEFIKTLDGSVLISLSAAEKGKYKRISYAIIRSPNPEISEKILGIWTKKIPKKGAWIDYHEPLTDIGDESILLSSSSGYISEVELLTPNIEDPERRVWKLTIEDDRAIEIGCKLESPNGLKHTVAGYTRDKEPTIVINPMHFKDRGIWYEIKDTGKIHCYPSLPGIDGNVSTRNIRISRTFVQGLFCYSDKAREVILSRLFEEERFRFPYPRNILEILRKLEKVDPDKLMKKYPEFENHFFYSRTKKVGDKIYRYTEPTPIYRALKKLRNVKKYENLPPYYQAAIDDFVNKMLERTMIMDPNKRCQIKFEGLMRIILWHSHKDVNVIKIGPELHKMLGEPEYVLWAKEPITRKESIRCMRVKIEQGLPKWCIRIHPYIGMDYETDEFHTKVDTDGDLGIVIPLTEPIEEAMYFDTFGEKKVKFSNLWKMWKDVTIDTVKHFEPYTDMFRFLTDVYEYNRRESLEQLCVQTFGGIKNRAMFTELINDHKTWTEFMNEWDIEFQLFQAEKINPELKEATPKQFNDFLNKMLKKAMGAKLPPYDPYYEEYRRLPELGYKNVDEAEKILKSLKKSKHKVLRLCHRIYTHLGII